MAPAESFANEASLWVEVLDAQGQVASSVTLGDLQIEEGVLARRPARLGRPLTVAPERARVVVYIDQAFGGRGAVGRSTDALAEVARDLIQLGDVELVVADAEPSLELRGVEALVLQERLKRMALTERGEPRIRYLREDAFSRWRKSARAQPPIDLEVRISDLVAALEEEQELVSERLQQMVAYLTRPRAGDVGQIGPKLLFLASEGFDLDPLAFYLGKLEPEAARLLEEKTSGLPSLDAETRRFARTLAASGWIAVPLSMPAEAYNPRGSEFSALETGDDSQRTSAPGVVLRPGRLFGRSGGEEEDEDAAEEEAALMAPDRALELMADAGGGFLVQRPSELVEATARLGALRRLSWPEGLDYDDGLTPIQVTTTAPGLVVRAPRWRSRGVPSPLADLRLDEVLAAGEAGELTLVAVLEITAGGEEDEAPTQATLDARLDLHDLEDAAELRRSDLRVTVEALGLSGEQQILQEVILQQDLTEKREWSVRRALELPADATAVAVVVEDMASGLWGGRRATVVRAGAAREAFLPAPASLEVQRPDMAVLRGRVPFEVAVFDSQIQRLQFLLDDREVARRDRPPWTARLDLGRTPRRQTLTVVGFNAAGSEVGRDSVILNGGDAGLSVSITEPTSTRGTGPLDVEAEISIPVERRLDRVIFFWNNEQVATLFAPPFRQRVVVPEDRPVGYVRVVAMLDDGSISEDVKFMNGPEAGEAIEVNLVELYVVVTDNAGRPVRGLEQSQFEVKEEGVRQSIATFSDAADLPLTLGMAIDSSASMFVKLPKVQKAASDFLRSTFGANDRSFVVDFDSTPRLARGTTNDVERVVDSIYGLEASGRTALWESIVFSLVQLQGVRGRKALVVFSDGADEDDQFPFRTCQRIAKEMGVPIYLILMKGRPEESAFRGLLSRSFTSRANRLTEATGGRVFYAKEYEDLGEVYDEIEEELRSQYLLAYYPQNVDRDRGWRDVDVELVRRDLKPRTLTGYWQ
ncbi:MAG: VWA domain-containing protein [Acidobacteriota bacterium]